MELQAGLEAQHFTSVDLVKAYFARIEEVNIKGPGLRAVLELNPSALSQAAELDKERKISGKRSTLHGIPVLVKVNFNFHHQLIQGSDSEFVKDNIATIASEGK